MRYVIGIDLGTTNTNIAFIDTNLDKNPTLAIKNFPILQFTNTGFLESINRLPSFYCLLSDHINMQNFALPWQKKNQSYIVGSFAKELGKNYSSHQIKSVKSWLCNKHVKRTDKILPLECFDASKKQSPVEVTAAYLEHIKEAWNFTIGKKDYDNEFSQQEIILTIPASFDEVSKRLTVELLN
jgi:molecular chaperone DnaK (HSP70)